MSIHGTHRHPDPLTSVDGVARGYPLFPASSVVNRTVDQLFWQLDDALLVFIGLGSSATGYLLRDLAHATSVRKRLMTAQRDGVLILALACGILFVYRFIGASYPEEQAVLTLVTLVVPSMCAGIAVQLLYVAPYRKLMTELQATDIRIGPKKLRHLYNRKK